MKLLTAEVTNFASYSHLKITFDNQGLTLIYGPTGAGKSTILDIVSWILWGNTSKDGAVDDIKRWTSNKTTVGQLFFELNGQVYTVARTRGMPKENDLSFADASERPMRGKDITETQKLINNILGFDYDSYVIAAYYNEWSITRNFFDSNAKQRRQVFENLTDLSFSINLITKIADIKKLTKNTQTQELSVFNKLVGQLDQLKQSKLDAETKKQEWEYRHKKDLDKALFASTNFETNKLTQLSVLSNKIQEWDQKQAERIQTSQYAIDDLNKIIANNKSICHECNQPIAEVVQKQKKAQDLINKQELLKAEPNPHIFLYKQVETHQNIHLETVAYLEKQKNPFLSTIKKLSTNILDITKQKDEQANKLKSLEFKLNGLNQLNDFNIQMRSVLLTQAVAEVETNTNQYLESYFNAELRVKFEINNDNLSITIFKNGHECSYKQLSKGQKCLLKLCFSVAVMHIAANKISQHFNTLFFDEALDGLDATLKVQAFNLFAELNKTHETIFVIDHSSELQNLFNNKIYVNLINDESVLLEV